MTDKNADDAEEDDSKQEAFMYFIRNGKFSVNVKTDHLNPSPLTDGGNAPLAVP